MRARVRWLALGCATLLALGCGAKCVDRDGDQHGENCAAGPDCDDGDARLTDNCDAGVADCSADPFAQGCPCYAGTSQACYSGDEATRGVGQCVPGRQICAAGGWTACRGEVLPDLEQCNNLDDDCDGRVDEGVLSPCGGCSEACSGGVWGPPAAPFEAQGDLALTTRGELTLAFAPSESRTVWVPNTGEGTVSKVDADAALEVARYRVAGATPERVAVDYLDDAWVLSPGLDGASLLTKIAGDRLRCGAGPTSAGPQQVLALGADACVLLQLEVGADADLVRTLAIDGTRAPDGALGGDVWLGAQQGQRMLQLSGDDAQPLREVATPGLSPFDAAFDPWGTLWLIDRAGLLGRLDPGVEPPRVDIIESPLSCYQFDSIASDAHGLLTLTGAACEDVVSYDPQLDHFEYVKTKGVLDTRGVAVLADDSWVVHTAGRLSRVQRDPLAILETFELVTMTATPIESTAVGADSAGRLWVVSSGGGQAGAGLLTSFDPGSGMVGAQLSVGLLPRPHGDITGSRRLGSFAPEGSAQHTFEGCKDSSTRWGALHVAATTGEGGSTLVQARQAEASELLDSADWVTLGSLPADAEPFKTDFTDGGVIEVQLTLRTAGRLGAPRIARVGLEWRCAGPD